MEENKKENINMFGLDLGGGGVAAGPTEISNAEGTILKVTPAYDNKNENDIILEVAMHLYYNAFQKDNSSSPQVALDCFARAKTFVDIAKNNNLI